MASMLEDIKKQSDWLVNAFNSDNLHLDYTIHSFIEIDKFFALNAKNGRAIEYGRLSTNLGPVLFSIGAYVGETFIREVPGSAWVFNDKDPEDEINIELRIGGSGTIWPMQRVIKCFKTGFEDSIYVYGYEFTKHILTEPFDQEFWKIYKEEKGVMKKPWWKIW